MGIGVIVVDDVYGFPGDVRDASAYPFPIQYEICVLLTALKYMSLH
jgi:hypothetical protein